MVVSRVATEHSSRTHPPIRNKPGVTNWVEEAGGLPPYIERIAKHLIADQGYSRGRAIATAKNTVDRWRRGGSVVKGGKQKVSASTQAKAQRAWASWERKANMSDDQRADIELALKKVGSASPSTSERKEWAKKGVALPDGSFPIPNKAYLVRAIKAFGRAPEGKRKQVKRHILKRARALGASADVEKRAKELNLATSAGETEPKRFSPEKHLRSPNTGQFVPKNQSPTKVEAAQRTIEGAIDKMKVGDRKALPEDLGWIEKTKSGFTIVGPGGFRKSVPTVSEAHKITDQIVDAAQRSKK